LRRPKKRRKRKKKSKRSARALSRQQSLSGKIKMLATMTVYSRYLKSILRDSTGWLPSYPSDS